MVEMNSTRTCSFDTYFLHSAQGRVAEGSLQRGKVRGAAILLPSTVLRHISKPLMAGDEGCNMPSWPKLRVLCLHGFRTSAAIFEKQIRRWDPSILDLLDLTFLDGAYPASGKSEVEAIFPGPYFEWFQFNKDYSKFTNLEEGKEFISKYMLEHGPFDGLLGFSQGGVLAAAFAGLQQKGLALQNHPPLRFIILVAGTGFNNDEIMHECYSDLVLCPSVHIIGDQDYLRKVNEELLLKFKDPVIVRHQGKHTVPRLGEEQTKLVRDFLLRVQSPSSSPTTIAAKVNSFVAEGGKTLFELPLESAKESECAKA